MLMENRLVEGPRSLSSSRKTSWNSWKRGSLRSWSRSTLKISDDEHEDGGEAKKKEGEGEVEEVDEEKDKEGKPKKKKVKELLSVRFDRTDDLKPTDIYNLGTNQKN
ncbi:hypothetical protein GBA52_016775 [Prunus armeniaca]|nr:hypothetical protein GBA52_016775 [Prunus armeniaca]